MESAESAPVVTTLPYWSSTDTTKVVRAVPAVPVAGGSVVKTTLLAAAGLMTVAGALFAVVRVREASVAVRVQLPLLEIVTALKVATPPAAVTESVPPRVQVEVRAIVSPEPVPVPYCHSRGLGVGLQLSPQLWGAGNEEAHVGLATT